jgi:hypothetical protein
LPHEELRALIDVWRNNQVGVLKGEATDA